MATINQIERKKKKKIKTFVWSTALKGNPQKRGRFIKHYVATPRKPNSALRKVGWILLITGKKITAKIPGKGGAPQRYAAVLVKGKGHKDTPGVKYSVVRGVLECLPLFNKTKRRSIYGAPRPEKFPLQDVQEG